MKILRQDRRYPSRYYNWGRTHQEDLHSSHNMIKNWLSWGALGSYVLINYHRGTWELRRTFNATYLRKIQVNQGLNATSACEYEHFLLYETEPECVKHTWSCEKLSRNLPDWSLLMEKDCDYPCYLSTRGNIIVYKSTVFNVMWFRTMFWKLCGARREWSD
jgi:hypothetical protein